MIRNLTTRDMKRTNVFLPKELLKQVKLLGIDEERTATDIITVAVKEYLLRHKATPNP